MKMPKRLNKRYRALMLDIISDINSETTRDLGEVYALLDEHGAPTWLLDWPIWTAGENMPGYMPESPYCLFLTERAAIGYCRELEHEDGHRDGGYVSDYMQTSISEILS